MPIAWDTGSHRVCPETASLILIICFFFLLTANKTEESSTEKIELQTAEDDERDEDENGDGDEVEDELDEEDDEEDSIMFEKRATLMAQEEGDAAWKHVAMGDLKVLYDHNIFGARIVLEADSTGERVSDTVICMQTEMQVMFSKLLDKKYIAILFDW